jgi:hypothetical protein
MGVSGHSHVNRTRRLAPPGLSLRCEPSRQPNATSNPYRVPWAVDRHDLGRPPALHRVEGVGAARARPVVPAPAHLLRLSMPCHQPHDQAQPLLTPVHAPVHAPGGPARPVVSAWAHACLLPLPGAPVTRPGAARSLYERGSNRRISPASRARPAIERLVASQLSGHAARVAADTRLSRRPGS